MFTFAGFPLFDGKEPDLGYFESLSISDKTEFAYQTKLYVQKAGLHLVGTFNTTSIQFHFRYIQSVWLKTFF